MSRIVRYEDEESGCRFEFLLQECLNYLAHGSRRLQVSIAFQASLHPPSDQPLVLWKASHPDLISMVADLLERGSGTAYCSGCDASFVATATVLERYTLSRFRSAESNGRRFYCRRGHCLLTVIDSC